MEQRKQSCILFLFPWTNFCSNYFFFNEFNIFTESTTYTHWSYSFNYICSYLPRYNANALSSCISERLSTLGVRVTQFSVPGGHSGVCLNYMMKGPEKSSDKSILNLIIILDNTVRMKFVAC